MGNQSNEEKPGENELGIEQANLIDEEQKQEKDKEMPVVIPEPVIFRNLDEEKNQKFESYKAEFEKLLEIKRNNLVYHFDLLKKETQEKKSIFDINEEDNTGKNNNNSFNKEIVEKDCCCCESSTYLEWNFIFIGPLFVIINLVGIFQLINILKATQNEMIFGIKSFLLNKTRINNDIEEGNDINNNITNNINNITSTIMNNFENVCFQNIPDFNVLFLTSAIGNLSLNLCGFRWSTFIFMIINALVVFFFGFFEFPEEKYDDFYTLLLLILYFVLLFISVGSIALFSQQVFFSSLKKYINLDDENKKNQNFIYFPYLCFISILSYFIYMAINYLFRKYFYENFFINNIYLFTVALTVSIIIYQIYSLGFIKSKKIESSNNSKNIYRFCGYLIYCETKNLKKKSRRK